MEIFHKIQKYFLLLPIFIYCLLLMPAFNSLPYLDGNIDFVMSHQFYDGGIRSYISGKESVHPPFKFLITTFSYTVLGIQPIAYTLPWLLLGVAAIVLMHSVCSNLFGKSAGMIGALLLSIYPLFIANALFGMTDFIMSVLLLLALFAYLHQKFLLLTIVLSCAVFTKETGVILVSAFLSVEVLSRIFSNQKSTQKIKKIILLAIPLLLYVLWSFFLQYIGSQTWNDWNFSSNPERSASTTILFNLVTGEILNQYALQHWKQLIFLNGNWLLFLIIMFACIVKVFYKHTFADFQRVRWLETYKPFFVLCIFIAVYSLSVLTFQTFTIPRYALPVCMVVIIFTAGSISFLMKEMRRVGVILCLLIFVVMVINLFSSNDPVQRKIWGTIQVFDQTIYDLRGNLSGSDGIAYNYQFITFAQRRSEHIKNSQGVVYFSDCYWMFPDPNNEKSMIEAFNLHKQVDIQRDEWCKDINTPSQIEQIDLNPIEVE